MHYESKTTAFTDFPQQNEKWRMGKNRRWKIGNLCETSDQGISTI
jgi:hypothetical protein